MKPESGPRALQARSRLQPLDIGLKHHRLYQGIRRSVLALSVAMTFGLPVWQLAVLHQERSPTFLGMPGAFSVANVQLLDPLALLGVLLARGPSWVLLWASAPALILVVVLGRFFCGWLCPYLPILAASNAARWLLTRLGLRPADLAAPRGLSRGILVAMLVASSLLGVQVLPWVYPPAVLGTGMFRLVFFGSVSAGAGLIAAAFLFDTFVSRAGFCRTLCPGGAMFCLLGAGSPIRVVREPAKCTDCTVCDVVCNLGQRPMTDTLDSGCERCGKCIAACPTDALKFALQRPL